MPYLQKIIPLKGMYDVQEYKNMMPVDWPLALVQDLREEWFGAD